MYGCGQYTRWQINKENIQAWFLDNWVVDVVLSNATPASYDEKRLQEEAPLSNKRAAALAFALIPACLRLIHKGGPPKLTFWLLPLVHLESYDKTKQTTKKINYSNACTWTLDSVKNMEYCVHPLWMAPRIAVYRGGKGGLPNSWGGFYHERFLINILAWGILHRVCCIRTHTIQHLSIHATVVYSTRKSCFWLPFHSLIAFPSSPPFSSFKVSVVNDYNDITLACV